MADPATSTIVSGTLAAVAAGKIIRVRGPFNFALWGTFVGTVKLERSLDGTNWVVVAKPDFTEAAFTAPVSAGGDEPEDGVRYRFNCTAYTSGTIEYRLSQ